jgi:hypothetical protein
VLVRASSARTPVKEQIMGEIGKHKLSDAIPKETKARGKRKGKPAPTHDVAAEQLREERVSAQAREAEASIRERMVNIGRGNQQAGRQGS